MNKTYRRWLGMLLVPLITACGGGGADPNATTSTSTTSTTSTTTPQAESGREKAQAAVARMTTPWTTAALQAPVPLPEYPRPQLTRTDWLNLNGKWSYTGGSAAPNAENPPTTAPSFPANPEQILVPYPVESYLSGIQRLNDRNHWYKRSFTVPAGWNGKRVKLNFGAVDRTATVYVNGKQVGQHLGGYAGFSFDITSFLRTGSNDLVVGAFDPTDNNGTLGKQKITPGAIFYTPSAGIWQTVWLEPVAVPHITRLDMTPDLPNKRLRVIVRGSNLAGLAIEGVASSGGMQVGTANGSVDTEFSVPVPSAHLWSPNDPFLYDLTLRVRSNGAVVDEVGSYFGMRSITVGTVDGVPRPLLNGKFVFQFGPLDQGFWPDGLYRAPTDEALKSDLQAIKDLGMNMVRKHIKVEPQRWFYWADKLGLLVWQDMPQAWNADSDSGVRARTEAEYREIFDEHRSSPAVISWVIFNEGWGDFDMVRMANQFKAWDPSRLINAHSGINFAPGDLGAGDVIDLHSYPGPSAPAYQPNRIAVLGEFGGGVLRTEGHEWNPPSTCCQTVYPDAASLTTAYLDQIARLHELATTNGLSAAVYTQMTDVEDEVNGFITYDRRVRKLDFARLRAVHLPLVAGVPALRRGSSQSLRTVTPGITNRYMRDAAALGVTEVVDANSAELLKKEASWKVVDGLADSVCLSFESVNHPGRFLRHRSSRLRIETNDNSALFKADASFCPRNALDGGTGMSLESKNYPGKYVRHTNSELWLGTFEDTAAFRAEASWAPVSGWWRSSVLLPLNQTRSLRVLTPGLDTRYVRHKDGLAFTEVVTSGSGDLLKQDATWRLVPGLADASCYSFESRNYVGQYLRHSAFRVHRDALENSDLYRAEATFCAQGTPNGTAGTRFASYNLPERYLRHSANELWLADGSSRRGWNSPPGFDLDTRWSVDGAWAP